MESLGEITAVLAVFQNASLVSFDGLENLTGGHDLQVSANPELLSLRGLEGWTSARDLFITSNDKLADVSALAQIVGARSLTVQGNPALPQCTVDALSMSLGLTCDCATNLATCP
jgi:hypothetical protein